MNKLISKSKRDNTHKSAEQDSMKIGLILLKLDKLNSADVPALPGKNLSRKKWTEWEDIEELIG